MTESQQQTQKSASLNPKSFHETAICELCFEDALKIGAKKTESLKPGDSHETSIRFRIDGLYKWYKSFSKQYETGSVFTMLRDISWYWASFCVNNETLASLVKEYFSLLKDITEKTPYTDLAERIDEAPQLKKVGRSSEVAFNISLPAEPHGIISDCATALGTTFSLWYQVGIAKALAANREGLYQQWGTSVIEPIFQEAMGQATRRIKDYHEIRHTLEYRLIKDKGNSTSLLSDDRTPLK